RTRLPPTNNWMARWDGCWWSWRTTLSCDRMRISCACRTNWPERKIALPSSGNATTTRCRTTTRLSDSSPTACGPAWPAFTAMTRTSRRPRDHVRPRKSISAAYVRRQRLLPSRRGRYLARPHRPGLNRSVPFEASRTSGASAGHVAELLQKQRIPFYTAVPLVLRTRVRSAQAHVLQLPRPDDLLWNNLCCNLAATARDCALFGGGTSDGAKFHKSICVARAECHNAVMCRGRYFHPLRTAPPNASNGREISFMRNFVFAGLLSGFLGGLLGAYVLTHLERVGSRAHPAEIRASQQEIISTRIALVDGVGKVRAQLAMSPGGGPGIF